MKAVQMPTILSSLSMVPSLAVAGQTRVKKQTADKANSMTQLAMRQPGIQRKATVATKAPTALLSGDSDDC
jgi:hypothetical protein